MSIKKRIAASILLVSVVMAVALVGFGIYTIYNVSPTFALGIIGVSIWIVSTVWAADQARGG